MLLLPYAAALLLAFLSLGFSIEFFSQLNACPNNCTTLGSDPKNWTFIHDLHKFNNCPEPVLFDLNIYNDITTYSTIRACSAGGNIDYSAKSAPDVASGNGCGNFTAAKNASVEVAWSGNTGVPLSQSQLDNLFGLIKKQLESRPSIYCKSNILFGKLGNGTVLGLYAGENIDSLRSFDDLAQHLGSQAMAKGNKAETIIAQHCGTGIDGSSTIGLVLSTTGDLRLTQKALQSLSNATCIAGLENTSMSSLTALFTTKKMVSYDSSLLKNNSVRRHENRDTTCSTVQVVSGDSCASLATKCGISAPLFTQYNPNICSTLAVGQFVCCSAGSLPDLRPKPGSDGSCATYTVQPNDFCDAIAKSHFITTQDIEKFNANTWGWQGCGNVGLGQIICLSSGEYTDLGCIARTCSHIYFESLVSRF